MKPKFDPSKPFEVADEKPKFDPNQSFEAVKDYNSPEALAAEAEATRMADIKAEYDKPLGVAVRSVGRGVSGGFSDEIGGVLGAIADQVKGTDKTFGQSYEASRDNERLKHKVDDINHPLETTIGKIGGGVISGSVLPGASTFAGSVGYGALQGAGESEAEDFLGVAKDAAKGGAMGAVGYGAGKAIPAVAKAVAHPIQTAKAVGQTVGKAVDQAQALGGAVAAGTREGAKDLPFGLAQAGGVVGGLKALFNTGKDKMELSVVANALRKTYGPGAATDLSDEAILMSKLLEPGDNVAKRLVASKYAAAHGGDAESYVKLLSQSADDMVAARSFDKIAAGKELVGDVKDTFGSVSKTAGETYGQLKNQAREGFEGAGTDAVKTVSDAIELASARKSISGSTRNLLDDVFYDLAGREGDRAFTQLDPAEQFDRLLNAKQQLGKAVKWAQKNELPEGQQLLSDTYNKFRQMTQSLDDMASADKGYSAYKTLEKDLFSKLGTVERGRIKEFDPIKVEKLFSGSESGRRLAAQVQKAREMLESGALSPEQAENLQPLLAKIDEMGQKAGLQRDITNFRYRDAGPTSPAVQRMSAIAGKDSAVTTAVRSPQMFLKMREEAAKLAQSQFGKSIDQLKPSDREAVAKYALWIAQHDGASDTDIKRKLLELGLMK